MTIRMSGVVSIGGCVMAVALISTQIRAQEHVGNAMNPQVVAWPVEADPDGLGIAMHARTPTGLLHASPRRVFEPRRTEGGWLYAAHLEFGGLIAGGDTANAKFREYKDVSSGFYLNSFGVSVEKPDTARYFNAHAGALGRDDQFFGAEAGTYNAWRIRGFYSDVPHVFTSTYRSLWNGIGTDRLTLTDVPAGGAVSAAATQAAIQEVLADAPSSEIGLIRHRSSVRFDLTLPAAWKTFGAYAIERREGARPFGLVFGGGGGGGNTEPPESIDATTTDVTTGVQYARNNTQLNVQASVSLFRSDIDTLTVENPLFVTLNTIANVPATSFTQARYDMHPDNTYFNVRVDAAHRMPSLAGSRVTGVVSLSRYRQNDALIPWTTASLAGGTINGVPTADVWNVATALTKTTTDATIDTTLVDVGWALQPARAFDLTGKLRYFDTRNDTEFWACNPLTGQWGRLINDGTGGAFVTPNLTAGNNPDGTAATGYNGTGCDYARTQALGLVPSAGNVNLRNVPFAHRQVNVGATAGYRLSRRHRVELAFEREWFHRDHRERAETWEDTAKVTYATRGFDVGTLRLSYAYGRRRGTPYVADPYEEFLSASLGPLPTASATNLTAWLHVVEQFRKFDLADRDRHTADARFNVALAPTVDASLALQLRDWAFPSSTFGRTDHQRQVAPSLDLTWQPSFETSISGFASVQQGRMRQTGLHPNACVLGNSYFFFSDGSIQTNNTGIPPTAPTGTSLVATERVLTSNWQELCGTAGPTSPLFPSSRTWTAAHRDRNAVAGLTAHHAAGPMVLDFGYTFVRARTEIDYDYNPAALAMTDVQAALAANGWSDLVFDQHLVEANASLPLRPWAGLHVVYRYENARIRDWHYDGVDVNPMPANNALYLDQGPRNYGAHVAGVFVRLELK